MPQASYTRISVGGTRDSTLGQQAVGRGDNLAGGVVLQADIWRAIGIIGQASQRVVGSADLLLIVRS